MKKSIFVRPDSKMKKQHPLLNYVTRKAEPEPFRKRKPFQKKFRTKNASDLLKNSIYNNPLNQLQNDMITSLSDLTKQTSYRGKSSYTMGVPVMRQQSSLLGNYGLEQSSNASQLFRSNNIFNEFNRERIKKEDLLKEDNQRRFSSKATTQPSMKSHTQKNEKDIIMNTAKSFVDNVVSQVVEKEKSKLQEQQSGAKKIAKQYKENQDLKFNPPYGLDELFQEAEVSNAKEVFDDEEEKEDVKPTKKQDKKEGSHQTRDGILYENITVPSNILTKFKLGTSSYKEYAYKFMKMKNKREKLGLSTDNTMLMSESMYLSGNPSTSEDNKILDLMFDEPNAFMNAMTLPKDQNKPTLKTPAPSKTKTPKLTQKEKPSSGAGSKSDSSPETDSSPPTEIPKSVSMLVGESASKNWKNNNSIGKIKIGKKSFPITKISKGREKNEYIVRGNFSKGESQTIRKFTYQTDGTFKKGEQVALKDVGMAIKIKTPSTKKA